MNKISWEIYQYSSCFYMLAVRDSADTDFNSPRLFHFFTEEEAVKFKELVEKSHCAIGRE